MRNWLRAIGKRLRSYPDPNHPVLHGRHDYVLRLLDALFPDNTRNQNPLPGIAYFALFASYALLFEGLAALCANMIGADSYFNPEETTDLHIGFLVLSPLLATMALYQSRILPQYIDKAKRVCGIEDQADALREKIQSASAGREVVIAVWGVSLILSLLGTQGEPGWRSIEHAFGPHPIQALGYWVLRMLVALNFYFILCLAIRWSVICWMIVRHRDDFRFRVFSPPHGGADAVAAIWHHAFVTFAVFTVYLMLYTAPNWGDGLNTSRVSSAVMIAFYLAFLMFPILRVPILCSAALRTWRERLEHIRESQGAYAAWKFMHRGASSVPPFIGVSATDEIIKKDVMQMSTKGLWFAAKDAADWWKFVTPVIAGILGFLGFKPDSTGNYAHESRSGQVTVSVDAPQPRTDFEPMLDRPVEPPDDFRSRNKKHP